MSVNGVYTGPPILNGVHAVRPAPSAVIAGQAYWETDTETLWFSDGASLWVEGGGGGSGSQGPQGATGMQGPQGSQGATGSTGSQGSQGATGSAGSQGATGSTGPQGSQGATGSTGTQGSQGANGAQGAQGAQGAAGAGAAVETSAALPIGTAAAGNSGLYADGTHVHGVTFGGSNLASNYTITASLANIGLASSSLPVGYWKLTVTLLVDSASTAQTNPPEFKTVVTTGAATFIAGSLSSQYVPAGSAGKPSSITWVGIWQVTTNATFNVQAISAGPNGVVQHVTSVNSYADCSTMLWEQVG